MATDRFKDLADQILALLEKFDKADVDNAVGDDSQEIKRDTLAEFLEKNFGG